MEGHFLKKLLLTLEKEKGGEREKNPCETETSLDCLSYTPPGDQTPNLGICPHWESNSQPFGLQDNAPTN